MTLTDTDIHAIRDYAETVGDSLTITLCDIALADGLADMVDPGEYRSTLERMGVCPEHVDADVNARRVLAEIAQ